MAKYTPGRSALTPSVIQLDDDELLSFGGSLASPTSRMLWETADPNANVLMVALPEGGAVDVPVFVIGDTSVYNVDLGLFNGITEPAVAVVDDDADSAVSHPLGILQEQSM